MKDQLTEAVKKERSEKMLSVNRQRMAEYEKSLEGKTLEILLEEECEIGGKAYYLGHSREYVRTAVEKRDGLSVNDIVTVKAESFPDGESFRCNLQGIILK